ncbi:hypothetical protein PVA44_07155 (plasmid) [Entomospira nematocerorum]|uniref:Outer membrane protein beta-barrel domain-containing protein n=1 Tax=Entomospira nematocerorum TaxID=2719987 RepID=A0A968KTH6_9SPIO|nr:hypothetical protein [Entomospira nematocera]NIZ47685.1 hypothetical protein [Entomospira nematocera]WDI34577.1 hypothetical protein PVA44_07155 [Entomospira nematocera]
MKPYFGSFKFLLSIIILFVAISSTHAFSMYVGGRVGLDVGYNYGHLSFSTPIDTTTIRLNRVEASFGGGIFIDLFLLRFLAITPQFHFQINRQARGSMPTTEQTFRAIWNEFSLEALLKFKLGWWYLGAGAGVVFNTTPKLIDLNRTPDMTVKGGNNLLLVGETGFHIPISIVLIQVAMRTSVNLDAARNILKEEPYGYMRNAFNVGLFLGFGVRLLG